MGGGRAGGLHSCDTFAKRAALAIDREIKSSTTAMDYQVIIMEGNLNRITECDLNRKKCRKTPYRIALEAKMSEFSNNNRPDDLLVLDVHSFPPDHDWLITKQVPGIFIAKEVPWSGDVAILLDKDVEEPIISGTGDRNFASFGKTLISTFSRDKTLDVRLIPGQHNDIMDRANELGFKKVALIEFNENLETQPEKFDRIVKIIAMNTLLELRELRPNIGEMPR